MLSPDGRLVVFSRDRSDGVGWLGAAPSDGSVPGHQVGNDFASAADDDPSYEFSPDGTIVIATYPGEAAARLLPTAGGPGSSVTTSGSTVPSMQRLAPASPPAALVAPRRTTRVDPSRWSRAGAIARARMRPWPIE